MTTYRADNTIIYESRTVFCKRISFRKEEIELYAYLYHDPGRETWERMGFLCNLIWEDNNRDKKQRNNGSRE